MTTVEYVKVRMLSVMDGFRDHFSDRGRASRHYRYSIYHDMAYAFVDDEGTMAAIPGADCAWSGNGGWMVPKDAIPAGIKRFQTVDKKTRKPTRAAPSDESDGGKS